MSDIVDFYLGKTLFHNFGSVLKVSKMNAAEFGKNQELVRFLFPIALEQSERDVFKSNKEVQKKYLVFFQKMMHFYDLHLKNLDYQYPIIEKLSFQRMKDPESDILSKKQRDIVLHILDNLYLVGFDRLANALITHVQKRMESNLLICPALKCFSEQLLAKKVKRVKASQAVVPCPPREPYREQTPLLSVNGVRQEDEDDDDSVRCSIFCGLSCSFFKPSYWPNINPLRLIKKLGAK